MANQRSLRRIAGFLRARLEELGLDEVPDPRSNQGKRWQLREVLTIVLVGLMAGCRGLTEVEELTGDTKGVMRRWLGIPRRLPDTTARSILCRLDHRQLRLVLHRLVIAAHHRNAWAPRGQIPFGIASMDGKATSLPCWHGRFAQRQNPDSGIPYGLLRTVTSTLVTSRSRGCIDVSPIPATHNEMSHFGKALSSLVENHKSRFQLVTYDQGANSQKNAQLVLSHEKDYLFQLNDDRRRMQQLVGELLEHQPVVDTHIEINSRGEQVTRRLRLMRVNRGIFARLSRKSELWQHTKTILRVDKETEHTDHRVTGERRYYASSLAGDALSVRQWNDVIRLHWGVETSHQILDTAFAEDDAPWIRADPNGTLVLMVLRRIAYTMLGLFRSVTQRSNERREIPWRRLMKQVYNMLVGADEQTVKGLRLRVRRKKRSRRRPLEQQQFTPVRVAA